MDVALKLLKKGYKVKVCDDAFTSTNVPLNVKGWVRQRKRWAKGSISIIKNNLDMYFNRKYLWSSFYSLPLMSYWYIHSFFMTIFISYYLIAGYYSSFYVFGTVISLDVLRYFFYWFSIFGIANLAYQILTGASMNLLIKLSILVNVLAYPLYVYSFVKWKEKLRIRDIGVLMFMFPYWMVIIFIQFFSNIEWFRNNQRNIWEK